MSLDEKLEKIKSPNLQSQQHTRVILISIEDTLREQNTKFTPTAYFAALLALLKQTLAASSVDLNDELNTSAVYLLDIVTSSVPPPLLRVQYDQILSVLKPFITQSDISAPLLRSSIGCLESLLLAQDGAVWALPQSQSGPRQAIAVILTLALDVRPKIRKRALEALTRILEHPPPGPAIDHPAAELCAVSALNNLKNVVETVNKIKKQRARPDESQDPQVIHALQLIKTIATASRGWPSKRIESLCELLLSISRSRNEYLVMIAFEVFDVIFEGMSDEVSSSKLPRLLEAIIELKPAQNDSQLVPPWIAILSRGYGVAGRVEPEETFAKVPELFDIVSSFMTSPSHNIRVSASECLISFFANCIPSSAILEPSIYDEKLLQQLAERCNGLLAVKFQSAWMEVFSTLSALFEALRWRGDPYLLPIVLAIGELRGNDGFQGKKEADEVLGYAIRNLGPEAILGVLPHNLMNPRPGHPGRAWLLPLLRDHVSNTKLAHFKSDLIPLSEAMYERVLKHGSTEKTVDIKIFETVVQQIWATLPGYCDLPVDLPLMMDQAFAELLSNLLYKQTELRVDLCRGLQNLVESNQAVIASDMSDEELLLQRRMTRAGAEKNIEHLSGLSSNLLAVLFNVYSQTLPQSRAYILQCINAYLSITPEKELVETFERVSKMFESSLPKQDETSSRKPHQGSTKNTLPPTSHTLIDLIIALSIYLPRSTFGALFSLASTVLTNLRLSKSDPQLIKKAYKLIPRLATSQSGTEAIESRNAELQTLILATADKTPVPARRDRLLAISTLLKFLPLSDLHFVPSILSEVVLACRDTNEKARTAGFDLLIALANKISDPSNPSGTVIRNSKAPHMPSDAPDAAATIEEVFTMVSAGLAGVAPHMVAASITALARLLFEFHHQLEKGFKTELVDTAAMFVQSNNREIVRSVLGFVKVMVVVLDDEGGALRETMRKLVPGLMVWSKENKGRLRVKVRSILERCVRRFGGEAVESWVEGEEKKMVINIRKRRERARRKRKGGDEDANEDEGGPETTGKNFDNEFDDAVYGSDDDEDVDDDDSEIDGGSDNDVDGDAETHNRASISFRKGSGKAPKPQYIRQDGEDDEPLDLLDLRSLSSITSSKRSGLFSADSLDRKKNILKKTTKVNEDGKLVFGQASENNDDDDDVLMGGADGVDGRARAVNAYIDAIDGPDAVRRGQKGRLKMKSSGIGKSGGRGGGGDQMDLDPEEAKAVAQQIRGSASPGSQKTQRRGLGVEKKRFGGGIGSGGNVSGSGSGSGSGRIGKRDQFAGGRRVQGSSSRRGGNRGGRGGGFGRRR